MSRSQWPGPELFFISCKIPASWIGHNWTGDLHAVWDVRMCTKLLPGWTLWTCMKARKICQRDGMGSKDIILLANESITVWGNSLHFGFLKACGFVEARHRRRSIRNPPVLQQSVECLFLQTRLRNLAYLTTIWQRWSLNESCLRQRLQSPAQLSHVVSRLRVVWRLVTHMIVFGN